MKITNKTTTFTVQHDIQIGEVTATLEALVFRSSDNKYDIDFSDILNIKYMGVDIKGFDNWRKFKKFHMEMGIDYTELIDKKYDEVFTRQAILKLIEEAE